MYTGLVCIASALSIAKSFVTAVADPVAGEAFGVGVLLEKRSSSGKARQWGAD
jgi:hypothetical protein